MSRQINHQDAESLAVEALTFLASDEERLSRFLALSGIDPAGIRQAAADPGFLGAVLDYLAGDERLLLMFAETAGRDPGDVNKALMALGGRAQEWG